MILVDFYPEYSYAQNKKPYNEFHPSVKMQFEMLNHASIIQFHPSVKMQFEMLNHASIIHEHMFFATCKIKNCIIV